MQPCLDSSQPYSQASRCSPFRRASNQRFAGDEAGVKDGVETVKDEVRGVAGEGCTVACPDEKGWVIVAVEVEVGPTSEPVVGIRRVSFEHRRQNRVRGPRTAVGVDLPEQTGACLEQEIAPSSSVG